MGKNILLPGMRGFGGLGGGASTSRVTASRLPLRPLTTPSSQGTGKFAERGLGAGATVELLLIARRSSLETARKSGRQKSDEKCYLKRLSKPVHARIMQDQKMQ